MNDDTRALEGDWRVKRLDGLLPPMIGVNKRIRGARGETRVGPLTTWRFRVERRGEEAELIYLPPFSELVDELRVAEGGSWIGITRLAGRELGRFRMTRTQHTVHNDTERTDMPQDRLHAKLVDYVENVHALEQNVLLQLDSLILNATDAELAGMFREHREETRRQSERLADRRRALGGPVLSAAGKDLAAVAGAQIKGLSDVLRPDRAIRGARDAFVTEHLEIAAYEILERLAERAGDTETARVARENRAEEEAMAQRITETWDRFLDLTLAEDGIPTRADTARG